MTTPPNDDWSDLTRTWTDATTTGPRLDPGLIRAVRHRDRLARLNFAAEIAGGGAVLAVVTWGMFARDLPWNIALVAIGFVGFALAVTLWSRRGDPGLLTGTPEAVLLSALAQARTGYRWAWAGVATSLAAFVFVTVLAALTPTGSVTPNTLLMLGAFLLVCIGFYIAHARRCRRRMAAHTATLQALRDDPAIEP
ncbi:MAG: hypothetical protein ACI9YM_002641 [Brevundimonas sp.]|jgi:hypothetical protein|uniref:hypothetical protein n=1 Tax=Brevundimonas sp. TaxID=1871086 RepID=UPI0039E3BE19